AGVGDVGAALVGQPALMDAEGDLAVGAARPDLADQDAGDDPAHYEEGLELTYADRIGRFTLQPDVQLIRYAGGLRDADTVVVVALRVTTALY
ncbi:carbohydrate porin, partial [Brevundimonas sp.]|uniref:carbohydrate porin n=1 Tax=Brevundimonas sp. TaxID=1871086 RepID=UPI0019A89E47